jgi:2-polyprenyl-6-methoxyphenol hydroxylase-like FAD-dependent oxidoreductase
MLSSDPVPAFDAQVAVVGAGPVGMTLAGRLAQTGVKVVLLEQHPRLTGEGSKALCMQRETLEIWARLGIGEDVARRGVQWNLGRTYFRGRELFQVRLPSSTRDHFPPFVNINQTEVEAMLLARLGELREVDLRWSHELVGISQDDDGVNLRCQTPDGEKTLRVAYLAGADGAHSAVRHAIGMGFPGHSFPDLFLICDIRARLPFPRERRFFFDPPWNPGRQVLIHPQPDDTWRIDWQVPPETDVEAERASGGLDRRVRAVIGATTEYELLWLTPYRFHQRLVDRFRIGRVFLAGDAAHLVSPFGARGLNSGVADAENLAWKLATVLAARASDDLLESYHLERHEAAVENLEVTDASMKFMVPHGRLRRLLRNAILRGSLRLPQLRRLVNSGRLAQPFSYADSPIVVADERNAPIPAMGSVAPDAPCRSLDHAEVTRLRELFGNEFVALLVIGSPREAATAAIRASRLAWPTPCRIVAVGADGPLAGVTVLVDSEGEIREAYGAAGSSAYLVRPDGHLAAWIPLKRADAVDALPGLQAIAIGG